MGKEIENVSKIRKWKESGILFDPDSSPKAWEHYEKNYTNIIYIDDYEIYGDDKKGYRLKRKAKLKEKEKNIEFEVAGDCSFNFNEDKKSKFESIINNDKNLDENKIADLKKELERCCEMHHTLYNFDLIPVDGEMNNVKGKLKHKNDRILVHGSGKYPVALHDRLDTFISLMDYSIEQRDEYEGKKCNLKEIGSFFADSIFTYSLRGENFEILYDLLENYKDVYQYCEDFYNIDNKEFINKLINNGKSEIKNGEDLKRYMDLANEFWGLKKKICKL